MCVGFLEKLYHKSGWKRWPVHQTQSWGFKCGELSLPFHCSSHCTLIKMSLKNEWLNISVAPVISMSIILKGPIIFPVLASWKTPCLLFTVLSAPVLLTQGTLTRIQGHLERWLMNQQRATWGTRADPSFLHFSGESQLYLLYDTNYLIIVRLTSVLRKEFGLLKTSFNLCVIYL